MQYCPVKVVDKNIYHSVTKVQCLGRTLVWFHRFKPVLLVVGSRTKKDSIAIAIVLHRL